MICFVWSQLPQYAARCIGHFVAHTDEECVVLASKPRVPVKGMEQFCGCPIHWFSENVDVDVKKLLGTIPRVAIINGWGVAAFNSIRDQVRSGGGRVYTMVDNNFEFSLRLIAKMIVFRLTLRHKYDGFLVPGKSGVRLLRLYGVSPRRIFTGMYAADPGLFKSRIPLSRRPKRILYVGQLIGRKNILSFSRVFLSIPYEQRQGWSLEICGCGPHADLLPRDESIIIHDFVQPEDLAGLYQNARVFCLPSLEEHWGLVVHEAALSGCFLLLSRQIGAAEDFAGGANAILFDARNEAEMRAAIVKCLSLGDAEFDIAETESLRLSRNASLEKFTEGCHAMIGWNQR